MYDIVIIGGGPAGATLTRLLDPKMKVLVVEKRRMSVEHSEADSSEGKREKCCGGLIAPDAQQMLAKLGLGIPKEVLSGPQLFTVRTLDFDNGIERYYGRNYLNVDREAFDRWLFRLLPKTVNLMEGWLFAGYTEKVGEVEITLKKDGVTKIVKSRCLVGADGGASSIRKGMVGEESDRYVSIQEWFSVDTIDPYFSSIFDREITDFYSWVIPKGEELIVGSAIPETANINERFELLKEKLRKAGFPLGEVKKRRGAYILRPRKRHQIFTGAGKIFLVGEAAGFISPSSAEGMSYGMKSGRILAEVLNQELGRGLEVMERVQIRYKKETASIRRNLFLKKIKCPAMYCSVLRRWIMKSGILSMGK